MSEYLGEVPLYIHDCAEEYGCEFYGTMVSPKGAAEDDAVLDLWVHSYDYDGVNQKSLIYRYSDDGPDYSSFPWNASSSNEFVLSNPVYREILIRAGIGGVTRD